MKTIKRTLLGALAGLTLAGCVSIKPKLEIGAAYSSGGDENREVTTEMDFGLEGKRDYTTIKVGGAWRTYTDLLQDNEILFDRSEYDLYVKAKSRNLEFYLIHTLSGFDKLFFVRYDEDTGKMYYIESEGRTTMGVRWKLEDNNPPWKK